MKQKKCESEKTSYEIRGKVLLGSIDSWKRDQVKKFQRNEDTRCQQLDVDHGYETEVE